MGEKMIKKLLLLTMMITTIFTFTGCGSETSQQTNGDSNVQQEDQILYQDSDWGVTILKTDGWTLENGPTEKFSNSLNISLNNGTLKAIVSVIPKSKTIAEIKNELKVGAGNINVIDDNENHLAFSTLRTESIRSDVFINEGDKFIQMIIFMTPTDQYENNKGKIDEFKQNVQFLK